MKETKEARTYRGTRYWEQETAREADAGRVRLRYFEDASKLQVVQLWRDEQGELRPGKTVTLDVEALALSDGAQALLEEVLRDARNRAR